MSFQYENTHGCSQCGRRQEILKGWINDDGRFFCSRRCANRWRRQVKKHEQVLAQTQAGVDAALAHDAEAAAWTDEDRVAAQAIGERFRRGVTHFFECGRILEEAKMRMPHGRFQRWVDECLPFGARTGRQFMQIARDPNIVRYVTKTESDSVLPPDKGALLELCDLAEEEFDGLVESGVIQPDMKRGDVRIARTAREHEAVAPPPMDELEGAHGAILADPPWSFTPYGNGGNDRSAERHYPTMSQAELEALPVGELAKRDCALFLWVVSNRLVDGISLMGAWGFPYVTSAFVWVKPKMGMGYWTRKECELCLLGIKGSPRRLNADVREVIQAPVGRHSEKPPEVRRRIERLVDGPYIELFARKMHLGWNRWGKDPTLREEDG